MKNRFKLVLFIILVISLSGCLGKKESVEKEKENIKRNGVSLIKLLFAQKDCKYEGYRRVPRLKGQIEVENISYAKEVYAVFSYRGNSWEKINAQYNKNLGSNKELWTFDTGFLSKYSEDMRSKFDIAVCMKVDGNEYWDNCNTYNHQIYSTNLGSGIDVILKEASLSYGVFKGEILVRNLSFNKDVTIVYTTDNWNTIKELKASHYIGFPHYEKAGYITNAYVITEKWDFEEQINSDKVEFAIRYNYGGSEVWDNNRNENYKFD